MKKIYIHSISYPVIGIGGRGRHRSFRITIRITIRSLHGVLFLLNIAPVNQVPLEVIHRRRGLQGRVICVRTT